MPARLRSRARAVVLATRRSRRRDERGAFAILFALLALVLMVLSAFTVDLGQAYVSKRQLQTAADAGALAAVQVYKGQTASCSSLLTNTTLQAQAQTAADKWAAMNRSGGVGSTIALGCNAAGGLTVDYSVSGSTPQVFGGLVTGGSTITTERSSQATIGGGVSVGNLRPWGICSSSTKTLGVVTFVPTYGASTGAETSTSICGSTQPPGNWWVGQCVGQSNGTPGTISAVANGCPTTTTYTVVPNQAANDTSSTTLYNWFLKECPAKTVGSFCLSGDTGSNALNQTDSAWQGLVGTYFQMPVFCTTPDCSAFAFAQQGNGNGASYGIEEIATVQLCGFHMKNDSTGWPTTGLCATANPHSYNAHSVTQGAGLFVVITALSGGPANTNQNLNSFTTTSLTK